MCGNDTSKSNGGNHVFVWPATDVGVIQSLPCPGNKTRFAYRSCFLKPDNVYAYWQEVVDKDCDKYWPSTKGTTVKPSTIETTVKPSTIETTVKPSTIETTVKPSTKKTTVRPSANVTTVLVELSKVSFYFHAKELNFFCRESIE